MVALLGAVLVSGSVPPEYLFDGRREIDLLSDSTIQGKTTILFVAGTTLVFLRLWE